MLISDRRYIYLLIIICAVFLLLIIFLYVFLVSRAKTKKMAKNLKNKVDSLNDFAINQFTNLLSRMNVIAQINDKYKDLYESYRITRDSIVAKHKAPLDKKTNEILELCSANKLKVAKLKIQEAEILFKAYFSQINELEKDLQTYLIRDEECHEFSIPYKRTYGEIKNIYLAHADELSFVYSSLNEVFIKIEKVFQEFDDLTNAAEYDKAKEKISSLDKVLDALKDYIQKTPSLCVRINLVIPEKIEGIKKLYGEFDDAKYPLHHLRINFTLEEIEKSLESIKRQIINFQIKNISSELDSIDEELLSLNYAFEEEKNARIYFDANIDNAYNTSTDLEKKCLKLKRDLPEYKKIYHIQTRFSNETNELQDMIASLARYRRELDTYMHSSSKQPYSVLENKLNELIATNENISQTIESFQKYFKSLKVDSDFAFSTMHRKFVSLKELEYKLKCMNIQSYEEELKSQFKKGYDILDGIGMIINQRPLNVEALNDSVSRIVQLEQMLSDEINKSIESMKDAEESIVCANAYRQEFQDAKQSLLRAENCFFEHDFYESFQISAGTIKKIDPKYR